MKKDMKYEIEKLLNSDINSNKLSKLSGVDQPTIHRIRKGESKLGNISLDKALKLYKLIEEMEKMENNKVIVWTGKNTSGDKFYKAEGKSYKDLYEDVVDKYGRDFLDTDAYEIALLEKNGEDLEQYDITTDGIGNWKLFEEFENRTDLKHLDGEDYRYIISKSDGNAYYQDFEERYYFEPLDTDMIEEHNFDINDFNMEEDGNGFYATNADEYLWILKFNNALNKLIDNGVSLYDMQVNEYQDYIDEANKLD